jgi:hypothetical protein
VSPKPQGELEWLQATLFTLQEGRYLTVGKVEKPKGPQLLLDIAAAANSRCNFNSFVLCIITESVIQCTSVECAMPGRSQQPAAG